MKRLFIIFIILNLFFGCKKTNADQKEPKVKQDNLSGYFTDKLFKNVLENNVSFIYSKTKKYCFAYLTKEISTNLNIKIDGYVFTNFESKWWFVFDLLKKVIIIKKPLNDFEAPGEFLDNENLFYFNLGTSSYRNIIIYNLTSSPIKKIEFTSIAGAVKDERADFLFSKDYNYVAYLYPYIDDDDGFNVKTGIKILNISTEKEIKTINPSSDENALEIIEWRDIDKVLVHKEVKNRGMSSEKLIKDNLEVKL
ncbi:MAG: hypothetical protein KAT05_12065 [Spirochaetes bacterium]|nr:hypothetical protein [Spirochaetota bacterium]